MGGACIMECLPARVAGCRIQKYIMCGCWIALWFFVFSSMATYALLIPDTLGWGAVELEASFGLLRLCFVLCTINGALMVNSLEDLWDTKHAKDVWKDFVATKLFSSRKLLYVLLFTQVCCTKHATPRSGEGPQACMRADVRAQGLSTLRPALPYQYAEIRPA